MDFKIPDTPEELFRQGSKNFMNINRWIPLVAILFVLLFFVVTSFYTVEQDEVGVIRRFGKYLKTTEPGLQWKMPFGIDQLDKVRVTRIFKEEFGFRTVKAGTRTEYSNKSFDEEALMLTGDLNVIDVSWIVQFKIKDPTALLFNVRNPVEQPTKTIRDLSESVMRQVIGDYRVTEAITTSKNEIDMKVTQKLQEALDLYKSGIQVTQVKLQEVLPPKPVAKSFNEVNEAEQERQKVINQAWEAYNKVIPKARGQAKQTVREAEGYALSKIKVAEGDAAKFSETWKAYKEAKDVTQRRMYLETLEEILPRVGRIYVFEPEANQVIPLLNLGNAGGL
ncbi:MAG: FtsH protease activity modulator HflK [Candidatus Omnitrophica bacterium]|nr:FtsH protease activity modulator HflK [Candidatus Omnitrophota bacterium]MCB9721363.1 FtsH protease activity modulator HflK [Candidatus Omnitrophota bacterium]